MTIALALTIAAAGFAVGALAGFVAGFRLCDYLDERHQHSV